MSAAFESGFFMREPAWHKQGVVLHNPPTTEEAIREAGLDWNVETAQLSYRDPFLGYQEIEDRVAIVRSNDRKYLSVVGDGYTPIQNRVAFSWFDQIAGGQKIQYESAGSLYGGRVIWILARMPGEFRVRGDDVVLPFLLLYSSHDGSRACSFTATNIRVVCANTLDAAERSSNKRTIRVVHTRSAPSALQSSGETLNELFRRMGASAEVFRALADKPLNSQELRSLNLQLFPAQPDGTYSTRTLNKIDRVTELFEGRGTGSDLAGRTAWGWLNAVAEYNEYVAPAMSRKPNSERAVAANWFGSAANQRREALELATALI